jgi:hypothetical protein
VILECLCDLRVTSDLRRTLDLFERLELDCVRVLQVQVELLLDGGCQRISCGGPSIHYPEAHSSIRVGFERRQFRSMAEA